MQLIRTFEPIGHGGFYTEKFKGGCNIIYDCGSTSVQTIIDAINNAFPDKNTVIDAVFISHFHEDHINGIKHLLEKCHVKKLFIPLLDNEAKQLLSVVHLLKGGKVGDFTYRFITDISNTINGKNNNDPVEIIQVREIQNSTGLPVELANIDGDIDSGTIITRGIDWIYIPFNFKEDSCCKTIKEYIKEHNMPNNSADMQNWWQEHQGALTEEYKKVCDELNTNSMVVYSGPKKGRCGCLYMGDYNAKKPENWTALKQAYSAYLDNIHSLQVPHHGSKYNFNKGLIEDGIVRFIVSVRGNDLKHPHPEVINDFKNRKKELTVVTELSYDEEHHHLMYVNGNWIMVYPLQSI